MATGLDAIRDKDGKLPAYAWPGGYPMFYLDGYCEVLCPDCANKPDYEPGDKQYPEAYDVNWEDESLYCADCSKRIESAYGDDGDSD